MNRRIELLRKYNVPGPRYTSYPTVPFWCDTPTENQWIDSISKALDEGEARGVGAAVYIHIPFCESLCTYCGCNTRITRNHKVAEPYIEAVLKEWGLYLSRLSRKIPISEIHLGGGTPTFLSSTELEKLVTGIISQSELNENAEFSLEADPRVTSSDQLTTLHRLGFRRLSLGVQDFDPKVQETVHRLQSEEQVRALTEEARSIGYQSVNYDLIYGLPFQTLKSIETTMNAVRRLRPDRIAFYAYAHVPWIKPGQRRFTEDDLPTGDGKRALYELGRQMLEEVGYHEVGMDHFALETDSLWRAVKGNTLHRNFMGYTAKQVAPLIGLGVSSIGDSWGAFAQNEKLVEVYQNRIEKGEIPIHRGHVLNQEDLVLRRHILNLMTQMGTEWNTTNLRVPHLSSISDRLAELERDGLLEVNQEQCRVTEEGRPFLRNICMAFDARLNHRAPTTPIFSKTI